MTLEATEIGAVDVIGKPGASYTVGNMSAQLADKIRAASRARIIRKDADSVAVEAVPLKALAQTSHKVIAIGASTGGTEALKQVLTRLPANSPGITVVQHMPANFTAAFADRLNSLCQMTVREARDNDSVVPGLALIAPEFSHDHEEKRRKILC